MSRLSVNIPQKAALSSLADEAAWAATGCKDEGRASSILFWEEPDCVSGCQLQPERTTFPRRNAPLSPEVRLLPQGQALLLSVVGIFVEFHQQELLMLNTN